MSLTIHRGGWDATLADLASVPLPDATDSYVPVPYGRLVEELKLHIPRFGLSVEDERYALAREGRQMFGVLTCRSGVASDWALAIGLRSSYDRSLAVDLVSGSRVFVCDNLAFHGESQVSRKHTANVFRDLPELVYRLLTQATKLRERTDGEIAAMKRHALDERTAHHLMLLAMRTGAIAASRLPLVLEAWLFPQHEEFQPRTAWSLFNAFTEIQKAAPPRAQMEGSLRLSSLFRGEMARK